MGNRNKRRTQQAFGKLNRYGHIIVAGALKVERQPRRTRHKISALIGEKRIPKKTAPKDRMSTLRLFPTLTELGNENKEFKRDR